MNNNVRTCKSCDNYRFTKTVHNNTINMSNITHVSNKPKISYRTKNKPTHNINCGVNNKEIIVKKILISEAIDITNCNSILIYNIVINNYTNKKFTDISLNDSIFSINDLCIIDVSATSYLSTVQTLNGQDIIENHGELIKCESYIEPYEVCQIILKLVIKNNLTPINNTLILTGKLNTRFECNMCYRIESIKPIYTISKCETCDQKSEKILYIIE